MHPASCQPQRTSPRQREPFPCLRSPELARASRPSAIRRNARRRPRRPLRYPRQPCQCSQNDLAQGIALSNLRRRPKTLSKLSLVVSYSGAYALLPVFTMTDSISI
jgi:hypothetical protein